MTRVMNKAGVILTNRDTSKVLVVINKNCMEKLKYGLPKGHREKGETIEYCAQRELREETGIILRVSPKDVSVRAGETLYYVLKAQKMLKPNPQDTNEIGDARWVSWEDIKNTDCNRGLRIIREQLSRGTRLMRKLRESLPRSVGVVRKKHKEQQNETKLGSGEEREGDAACDGKEPTLESNGERPEIKQRD